MLCTRFGANASGTAGELASSVMAFDTIDIASTESERNKLQPQRFLKPTPRPAPILADDADTPSLAVAFDKLGLPDAERCAAKDCVRYIMAGQVTGLAVGGTVGWAIGGLRAIPIALCAMIGGQVGAVYPTQLTTRSLLTLPGK